MGLIPRASGVYVLTAPSGSQYVGSSKNMFERVKYHARAGQRGNHESQTLRRAYAKWGVLEASILELCPESELLSREQFYIDTLVPEYNCSKIAGKVEVTEAERQRRRDFQKGRKASDETKAKLSKIHKGRKKSLAHKQAIARALKGREITWGAAIAAAQRGIKRGYYSEAHIQAIKAGKLAAKLRREQDAAAA